MAKIIIEVSDKNAKRVSDIIARQKEGSAKIKDGIAYVKHSSGWDVTRINFLNIPIKIVKVEADK